MLELDKPKNQVTRAGGKRRGGKGADGGTKVREAPLFSHQSNIPILEFLNCFTASLKAAQTAQALTCWRTEPAGLSYQM